MAANSVKRYGNLIMFKKFKHFEEIIAIINVKIRIILVTLKRINHYCMFLYTFKYNFVNKFYLPFDNKQDNEPQ